MNGNKMIYIIDDNQYGELSKACGYIEAGIYNDVVRWVKPSKETKVEDFHDAACICYHSSLAIEENGVWKQASMLVAGIEDLMDEIPLVKYSKGCTAIDYDEGSQIIYGMPKETFYKRLKHFVQHYKNVGKVDLEIFSKDYLETSSPNNIVVFGNEENLSSSQLLKQANECEFYAIDDDKDIDDIIISTIDSNTDTIILDLDEYAKHGIQLAFTTRLMCEQLRKAVLARIIGVTEQSIDSFYRYFPYSQILQTEGFAICSIEDLDSCLANTPLLTCDTFESGFLDRINIKEYATYGHHSLANEWGLMALNRFVSKDTNCISEILRKAEKNMFFRYSVIKNMDIRDVLEDTFDNEKKDANLIPKQDKQKGGKYLLIDDKGNEGWKEVLMCCVRDVEAFDVHDKETASYNAIPQDLRDKLKEGFYDVIFLDLRLMACEENKDLNVMDFSGMKVLQGIKQANPGNQVIIFTASSKSWNLKALIDNGADEYYLKESPLFHFSKEESKENAKHLVKTIGYCYRRSYLRKSYKLVEGIKEKINASPRLNENNKKETIAQLDMAFHQLLKITGTNNKNSFAYTFVAFEFVIPLLCKHLSAVGSNTPEKFEDLINTQLATSDTKLIYDGKQMIQARNAYMHGNKTALKSNFSFVFHAEGILKILEELDKVSQLL